MGAAEERRLKLKSFAQQLEDLARRTAQEIGTERSVKYSKTTGETVEKKGTHKEVFLPKKYHKFADSKIAAGPRENLENKANEKAVTSDGETYVGEKNCKRK